MGGAVPGERDAGGHFRFVPIALSDNDACRAVQAGMGEIIARAAGVTVHVRADVSADHIERVLRAMHASE